MDFPRAKGKESVDGGGGWVIDPSYLRKITDSANDAHDDEPVSWEQCEAVLLALERLRAAQPAVSTTTRTNREAHEEAAGMNLSDAFFALAGIDPDGHHPAQPAVPDVSLFKGVPELLDEAADDIADWSSYASTYFREKHKADQTIEKYRARARLLRELLAASQRKEGA